ncbi:MAG: T9SS sorting signal type C domain-containing protein [Flavobacterium sp.]|uniref:T9SS sorting signal type C domain-containing protein n=1 Tax=Flavobacterium sp. TaxID=239 RepID=UPI0032670154
MKHNYFQKRHNFILLLVLSLFTTSNNNLIAQCATTPPADVTINCGTSTTLSATTTAVSYSVVTSACTPVAITGTNAFPTACDDCVTGQIPIGFPFNFYGNTYTTAVIQSNGILGFGPTFSFTGYSAFAIPALGNPNNYIAGFFADIDIRYGGAISYQTVGTAPNRKFVVSYSNVVPYNSGSAAGTGTASFQIVLNETGSFQVIVSQLSANWNASTSGALATSGAENDIGTLAFPVPGRNSTDWPGITPANQDCTVFNPQPCIFQRWQQGATVLTTNPNLTVSPTSTSTYTAYWNCGASPCSGNTIVNVTVPSYSFNTSTDNTNCSSSNGSISFNTTNLSGSYNLSYNINGSPTSQTVTSGGGANIAQGSIFNSGTLAAGDTTWIRNSGGTTCGATAGTDEYYDVFPFTVSTSGSYTLNMCTPGTNFDAHASLYQNAFNGGTPCATPANFIIADDDSNTGGNCEDDSSLTATLSTGVTYYLVSTSFSTGAVGNYEWTFTGPAAATLITGTPKITLSNLAAGTYSNFQLNTVSCGILTIPGPFTILDTSAKTWSGTTNTNWSVASNWSGGVIPNSSDCVVIPNVTNDPIVSGVGYEALAGTLTVLNGGNLTITSNNFITVTNAVTVNAGGVFTLNDNSSLLQTNNVVNSGDIIYLRNANNIRGADFVYWSSPVANQNINGIYTVPVQGPKYSWNTTGINARSGLGRWDVFSGTMTTAKGYILRGSSNSGMAATTINGNFTGVPNNGNITIAATRGNMTTATVPSTYSTAGLNIMDDNWNLLGNPYPSAINGLQFLSTNSANLLGTLRLWRHLNTPALIASPFYQNFQYNYNSGDYLTINFTGPTVPGATDIVKSGQAFMVQRIEGTQDLVGANIVFNNAMRRNAGALMANDNFYKTSSSNQSPITNNTEKSRIWLDIVDDTTNSSETTLLGYIEGATNNFDSKFDATIGITTSIGIYTFTDNKECIIQGKSTPFNKEDIVPIGINIQSNGGYHIAIKAVDGVFANGTQIVYLEDKLLNIIHNLNVAPYSFTSTAGLINDRFVLRYNTTSINNSNETNDVSVFLNNHINVNSSAIAIKDIIVYDVLGKTLLDKKNINKNEITLNELKPTTNVLIVKVILENNKIVMKKVIY